MPQVSSMGRFRSSRGVITRPKPNKDGYVHVQIFEYKYQVHSLVTCAFHGPAPSPQYTANHKDRNRSNNNVDNLEWGSKAEQARHSFDTNPDRRSNAGQQSKAIKATPVDDAGAEQETLCFASQMEAARELGVDRGAISACCQGKIKTAGGKDGRRWSFCFDTEAAQPALLKDEEWKDVVAGHGLHEVDVTGIKGITGQTEGQVDIAQVREEVKKRGMTWPQVSSLGRFKDSQGIIKVPIPSANGYVQVQVFGSKYLLHGLVARAFIEGKVPPGHTVDHIDLNRSNNAIENLQYLTPGQQVAASYATNPDRESSAGRQSKAIKATRVDDSGAELETLCFASQMEAAGKLGMFSAAISACCLGKIKTAGGKDGGRWCFCFDTEAGEPEFIEGEEWRDVVMAGV